MQRPSAITSESSSTYTKTNEPEIQQRPKRNVGTHPRELAASMCSSIIVFIVVGIPVFLVTVFGSAAGSALVLGTLGGLTAAAEVVHYEWHLAVVAIDNNDVHGMHVWIEWVNPEEYSYNGILDLTQYAIIAWDYIYGFLVMLFQIFMDVFVPMIRPLLAEAAPYVIEGLMFCREGTEILLNVWIEFMQGLSSSAGVSPQFAGTGVGIGVGGSASFAEQYRPVTRFVLKLAQSGMRAMSLFIVALGITDTQAFLDFFNNIVLKYCSVIFKWVVHLLDIMNTNNPLGKFIMSMADYLFKTFDYANQLCGILNSILRTICQGYSYLAHFKKTIENALSISLPALPNCNPNSIGSVCSGGGSNPFGNILSGAGVGECNATACSLETIEIIGLLQAAMPNCGSWTATSAATMECMSIVYNFSNTQSISNAQTPIDAIAKELCFVLTVTIMNQCTHSLPPFAFSFADAANAVCVVDRSGLVPPNLPFNDGCACVYTAPLCNSGCCDQYSRHINGQVMNYVGSRTCGQILTTFPRLFWCQFYDTTAANITNSSDYTFSSAWCEYWQLVLYPLCSVASPIVPLNVLVTSGVIDSFSSATCNSTVNQVGVCIRINTTIDSSIHDFQFELGSSSVTDVYDAFQSDPPLGTAPIVTIPTASTPLADIPLLMIRKYYCYEFMKTISNPAAVAAQYWSVNAIMLKYCQQSLGSTYAAFDLTNYTYFLLTTPTGSLQSVDLASIPAGVSPFGTVGGGTPPPSGTLPDCPANGNNPQEVAYQQQCSSQYQTAALTASVGTASSGISTNNELQSSAAGTASVVHIGGYTQPSNGNQQVESTQMNTAAATVPNYQATPTSQLADETTNFRTHYPSPPANAQTGIYLHFDTTPATRNLLSIDPIASGEDFWSRMQSITYEDPFSAQTLPLISERAARRGRAKLEKIMRAMDEESNQPDSNYATTRRLMATGNAAVDAYINNFWDRVAQTNVADRGISDADLQHFLASQAAKDIKFLFKHTEDVLLPNLYNAFYGGNFTDYIESSAGDYEASFGTGIGSGTPTGRCKNTLEKPLQCCKPNSSPFACCYGLPLFCFNMLPKWMFTSITTMDNVKNWRCKDFDGFLLMWYNSFRAVMTFVVRLTLGDKIVHESGFFPMLLRLVTFHDLKFPPFWGKCMLVNSVWIFLGVLIFIAAAFVIAALAIGPFCIMVDTYQRDLHQSYLQQSEAEKAATLPKLHQT